MAESDTGKPSTSRISIIPPPIDAPRIEIACVAPAQVDGDAVGVRLRPHVLRLELEREAALAGEVQGVLQMRVVDLHPERARDESPVGAVAAHRLGEGRVELEARLDGLLLEQRPRHVRQTAGPRRVRGGRTDHDGTRRCRGAKSRAERV